MSATQVFIPLDLAGRNFNPIRGIKSLPQAVLLYPKTSKNKINLLKYFAARRLAYTGGAGAGSFLLNPYYGERGWERGEINKARKSCDRANTSFSRFNQALQNVSLPLRT